MTMQKINDRKVHQSHIGCRIESMIVFSVGILVGVLVMATFNNFEADSEVQSLNSVSAPTQPYGGCEEAHIAPRSEGAQMCRDMGWTVKRRVVLNPRGVIRYWNLPKCDGETMPCGFLANDNTSHSGGISYALTGTWAKHRTTYLWAPSPLLNHPRRQWVRSGMADALAEGSSDGSTTRKWNQCWTNGNGVTCPDGYSEVWP